MLLKIKKLTKTYNEKNKKKFKALKKVSVSFRAGEFVAIVGESGSGKSTFMNVIGSLDSDFTGKIIYKGTNIGTYSEKEKVHYRQTTVGFVFQNFNLISHLNIIENITIAMPASISRKDKQEKAEILLAELGMAKFGLKKPSQLSGGQCQRVAIARALINDPEIILADEPTGSLDEKTAKQVLNVLKKIARSGKLVIMVTHSSKVAQMASRTITIDNGKIIHDKQNDALKKNKRKQKKDTSKRVMGLKTTIQLAFSHLKQKKGRNVLITFGLSIGIFSIIAMMALGNGLTSYIKQTMNEFVNPDVIEIYKPSDNTADDENETDTNLSSQASSLLDESKNDISSLLGNSPAFTDDDFEQFDSLKNIKTIEKGYRNISVGKNTILFNSSKINFNEIQSTSSLLTDSQLVSGEFPKKEAIMISETLSTEFSEDIVGKKMTVQLTIGSKTIEQELTVSGIYKSNGNPLTTVYFPYDTLNDIYKNQKTSLDTNVVFLTVTKATYLDSVKEKIKELGYSSSIQDTMITMFTQLLQLLTLVLTSVAAISLFVASLMILVVFNISVGERTNEIGVLKALGSRNKDIRRIFVFEALFIGIWSGFQGLVISFITFSIANRYTQAYFGANILSVKRQEILFALTVCIGLSILASLFPANKASKLDPVDALKK